MSKGLGVRGRIAILMFLACFAIVPLPCMLGAFRLPSFIFPRFVHSDNIVEKLRKQRAPAPEEGECNSTGACFPPSLACFVLRGLPSHVATLCVWCSLPVQTLALVRVPEQQPVSSSARALCRLVHCCLAQRSFGPSLVSSLLLPWSPQEGSRVW